LGLGTNWIYTIGRKRQDDSQLASMGHVAIHKIRKLSKKDWVWRPE